MARYRGVAVGPLDEPPLPFGVDIVSGDPDTDPRAERTCRNRFVHAQQAAIVGLASDGHLQHFEDDPLLGSRIAMTVASQRACAARVRCRPPPPPPPPPPPSAGPRPPVCRASTLACGLESDSRRSQIAELSPLHWHQRRSRCEDQAPRQPAQRLGSPYPILHTAGHRQFNRSRGRCHGERSPESASRYTYRRSSSGRLAAGYGLPRDRRQVCPGRG